MAWKPCDASDEEGEVMTCPCCRGAREDLRNPLIKIAHAMLRQPRPPEGSSWVVPEWECAIYDAIAEAGLDIDNLPPLPAN